MFKHIFLFEIRYRLRRPATYVYFGLYFLIGMLYGSILGGAFGPEVSGMLTQGGKNFANSPYNLHLITNALGQFGVFVTAAFMGVPIFRDYQRNAHSLFFTKPITKWQYLGGRFAGSMVVTIVILFSIVLGLMITEIMPYVEANKYGDFNLFAYINPFIQHVIPFTVFSGCIFFATVSLSRNQLFIYLNAILILVLLSVASGLMTTLENKTLASLLDPTGSTAFIYETEYWTVVEKNTQTLPYSLVVVGNQLIWLMVGVLILLFTYIKFQFSYVGTQAKIFRSRKTSAFRLIADTVKIKRLNLPQVSKQFGFKQHLAQLKLLFVRECGLMLKSPIFWVLISVGVLMFGVMVGFQGLMFGTSSLPVTYQMIEMVLGSFMMFILAIIVFYSGEMVWKERSVKINHIYDALPIPNWLSLSSKMLAMTAVLYLIMGVLILCGIITQLVQGFFDIDLGLYIKTLLGYRMINLLLFTAMAFFIQVVANNKYLGFFLTAGIYLFIGNFFDMIGLEHRMFSFMSGTPLPYSDMNGYGHFAWPYLSFKLYWGGLAAIMIIFAFVFWSRGPESHWKTRLKLAKANLKGGNAIGLILAASLFIGMGSYIYYNTNVLNEYVPGKKYQQTLAEYEKKYKKYDGIPLPKVTGIKLDIELFPEKRDYYASGTYLLKNKSKQPIDTVHLLLNTDVNNEEITFSIPNELISEDKKIGWNTYKLAQALMPGDSLEMSFKLTYITEGFTHSGGGRSVVENGTFFSQGYFPQFAYEPFAELQDPDIREKYGLERERERFPSIDDTLSIYRNLISRDADWIDFEATVSTSGDQIAVLPGYLQKEWQEDGRNHFHYKMDSKMLKFFSIVSGRYEVKRDVWQAPDGREVKLEIYHHPSHTYNLDRMMLGMKEALAYCTEAFGPYQHQQVRILEFPRYRTFAQSFANTVPFAESAGFIADVGEDDVDYPLYITAHEVAHQWWAHQVVGGYVQGFQFLSETMAQYSALMVMERNQGTENIQKYLRHEMNSYLMGRAAERTREMPALLSENQPYIHYNKGSVIMYALKDYIGEDSVNAAMKRFVDEVKFQEPPYTTTKEWMKYINEVTPDSLQFILYDMFETITLFENRVESATYTEEDGRYKVTMNIKAKKLKDDGEGNETELDLNDYIDVGVFGREKVEGKWEDTILYFQKHKITQNEQTFELWVDAEPREAGIDPYNKLIDRNPRDNRDKVKKIED